MLYGSLAAVLATLLMQAAPHLQEYLASPLAAADKLEAVLQGAPTDSYTANELGRLYSACALGVTTVTSNGLVTGASLEKQTSATAKECLQRLSQHKVSGVIAQGAYQLAFMGTLAKHYGAASFDAQDVAENLADKTISGPNAGDVALWQRLTTYRFRFTSITKLEEKTVQAKRIVWMEEDFFTKAGGDTYRFLAASQLSKDCLLIQDWARAAKYAKFLLDSERSLRGSWNYGNAMHDANLAMGEVALHQGDAKAAAGYLIAAGKTPGSPQLNSFGPNMTLARDLILAGERKAVVDYFTLCAAFWKLDRGRLADWTATVAQGGMPDFGANMNY